jgi:hypothetical protein
MLSVVTWRWKPRRGYRSSFGPETVNVLRSMVRRWYPKPHRFICVTDDPAGIEPGIEIVPLWSQFADLANPNAPSGPSCYRRLRMFSAEAGEMFGPRFVSLDLDCVITGDLTPLWDRPEAFVAWGDTNPRTHYNGSMILMTAGARRQVWDEFDPRTSPGQAKRAGHFGSDQAWISHRLGPGEATWTTLDGVYSYRNHLKGSRILPPRARVVFFHGGVDPWSAEAAALPWVARHYRRQEPRMIEVTAIDETTREAMLSDGRSAPITSLFDASGAETDDLGRAVSFVAGADGVGWFNGSLAGLKRAEAR